MKPVTLAGVYTPLEFLSLRLLSDKEASNITRLDHLTTLERPFMHRVGNKLAF